MPSRLHRLPPLPPASVPGVVLTDSRGPAGQSRGSCAEHRTSIRWGGCEGIPAAVWSPGSP